jgi:hypothetical protein
MTETKMYFLDEAKALAEKEDKTLADKAALAFFDKLCAAEDDETTETTEAK